MIAPETLAAALRVAQHGARRAMLAARGDTTDAEPGDDDDGLGVAAAAAGHADPLGGRTDIARPAHQQITPA